MFIKDINIIQQQHQKSLGQLIHNNNQVGWLNIDQNLTPITKPI